MRAQVICDACDVVSKSVNAFFKRQQIWGGRGGSHLVTMRLCANGNVLIWAWPLAQGSSRCAPSNTLHVSQVSTALVPLPVVPLNSEVRPRVSDSLSRPISEGVAYDYSRTRRASTNGPCQCTSASMHGHRGIVRALPAQPAARTRPRQAAAVPVHTRWPNNLLAVRPVRDTKI